MKKNIKLWLLICLILVMLTGCHLSKIVTSKEQKIEVYVLAASSLTESMTEIVSIYNDEHEESLIILNLAGSGSLQRQIEQGAPADIFISASKVKMDTLKENGLVDQGDEVVLFSNQLVLIGNSDDKDIKGFESLMAKEDYIFAMGEPGSVPAGAYGKEALEAVGLYEQLIKNTVLAKNVKEVLTWVELGEVDAGLVYLTDALVSEDVKILSYVDTATYQPIIYPGAIVKTTENRELAEAFFEFLQSETAMTVFEGYGFIRGE